MRTVQLRQMWATARRRLPRLTWPMFSPRGDRLALAGAGLLACLAAGCERIPDPCIEFKLACLAVTVTEGPTNVRRLSVYVDDGIVQYMQPTPMKPPKGPLLYPLRFAVRFGEFENAYRGYVDVKLSALNDEYDVVGVAEGKVPINGREKTTITLSLTTPPVEVDMADPPPDMASGDMTSPVDDMSVRLDMP